MRHLEKRCAILRHAAKLVNRKWHCCDCGWPNRACAEMYPMWREMTTATSPRCGDDARPYLMAQDWKSTSGGGDDAG